METEWGQTPRSWSLTPFGFPIALGVCPIATPALEVDLRLQANEVADLMIGRLELVLEAPVAVVKLRRQLERRNRLPLEADFEIVHVVASRVALDLFAAVVHLVARERKKQLVSLLQRIAGRDEAAL